MLHVASSAPRCLHFCSQVEESHVGVCHAGNVVAEIHYCRMDGLVFILYVSLLLSEAILFPRISDKVLILYSHLQNSRAREGAIT